MRALLGGDDRKADVAQSAADAVEQVISETEVDQL
jgi:hypothetical protein